MKNFHQLVLAASKARHVLTYPIGVLLLLLTAGTSYAQTDYTIGTGTSTNSSTGLPSPYFDYYEGDRQQYLYRASELTAAGMTAGMITAIKWDVVNVNGANPQGWSLYIGSTSTNALSSTFQPTPSYQVEGPAPTSFSPTSGTNVHQLAVPFYWDGVENIIIQVCHGVGSGCRGWTRNAAVRYSTTSFYSTTYYRTDCNGSQCGRTSGTRSKNRPNITLSWSPVPTDNAGVAEIVNPPVNFCAGNYDVKAKIVNNGQNTINSVDIYWFIDGVAGTGSPITYTTPISPIGSGNNSADVTLENVSFTSAAARTIEVYTSMPNGNVDTVDADDTLKVDRGAALNGTYVVGTAGDFITVKEAADALSTFGVCGAVIMDIEDGTYLDPVVLNDVWNTSATNTVTFKSKSDDATKVTVADAATGSNSIWAINNTSYVRLENLTIQSNGTNTGRVLTFSGDASFNKVENCILNAPTNATSSNTSCIYATSLSGEGNEFYDNTLNWGYYGIYWRGVGSASSSLTPDNIFEGNTINNAYVYSNYFYYTSDLKYRNNTINAQNAPTTHYGIYAYYSDNGLEVSNNKITIQGNGTGTKYGMRFYYNDATSSNMSYIINNSIAVENSNGTAYGFYAYYSRYQNFINNSVNVNSSSASSQAARFYYSNSNSYRNNTIRNNVFSNSGSSGLAAYIYYVGRNNSYDYNNYYSNSGDLISRGSPSGNYKTLTAWRGASGEDANSISYEPGFTSNTDLTPDAFNKSSWSLNGRAVHLNNNNKDIAGNTRVTQLADGAPDIGAYEFEPQVEPPLATAVPANVNPGDKQEFFFGENLVVTINWNDDLKVTSPLNVKQYSGRKAPSFNYSNFMYFYTDIEATAPSQTYNFDPELNYMETWLGTMPGETDVRLAQQYKNSAWVGYVAPKSTNNVAANEISAETITNFGKFTGTLEGEIFSAYITPDGSTVICIGDDVVLTANSGAGYTYKWKRNGVEIPNATMQAYTATTPGDYTVEITANNVSVESMPVTVSTIAPPNAPISANTNPTFCVGNGLTLSTQNGSGLTYQWKLDGVAIPGATGSTYQVAGAGNYTVVVENIGCAMESVPQVVTAGPLNVDLGPDKSVCEQKGFPIELDAGYPGAKHIWNNGATTQKITITKSGSYIVTVDAGPNCIDQDTIVVDVDPLPSANGISYVKNGNDYLFSPSAPQDVDGVMWIFSDGTTYTTNTVNKTISGDLYVRLVLYNTCGTDTVQIGWPLSVGEVADGGAVNIYPNPAKDKINVEATGNITEIEEVSIINNLGAVVIKQQSTSGAAKQTINVSALPAGYYMMRISTESGIVNKPFNIVR